MIHVETLHAGDIFGESSFLNGQGSKAASTIICETGTYLTVIEGFFLDILFDYFSGKDGLCSRFYFYIATELFKRLKRKYRAMNSQPNNPGNSSVTVYFLFFLSFLLVFVFYTKKIEFSIH